VLCSLERDLTWRFLWIWQELKGENLEVTSWGREVDSSHLQSVVKLIQWLRRFWWVPGLLSLPLCPEMTRPSSLWLIVVPSIGPMFRVRLCGYAVCVGGPPQSWHCDDVLVEIWPLCAVCWRFTVILGSWHDMEGPHLFTTLCGFLNKSVLFWCFCVILRVLTLGI
jgi:hypothetical protein